MNLKEFLDRFPTEIGRTKLRDKDEHHVYATNGAGDIGVWITNTRTTEGHGEELTGEHAAACSEWCREQRAWADRARSHGSHRARTSR